MYQPDRSEITAAIITLALMMVLFGSSLGTLIYLAGAAATYVVKSRRMPTRYFGMPHSTIAFELALWPLDAWHELQRARK